MTDMTAAPSALELLVFDRRFRIVGGTLAAAVLAVAIGFMVAASGPMVRPAAASSVLPAQAYALPLLRGVSDGFVAPVKADAPAVRKARPAKRTMVASSRR